MLVSRVVLSGRWRSLSRWLCRGFARAGQGPGAGTSTAVFVTRAAPTGTDVSNMISTVAGGPVTGIRGAWAGTFAIPGPDSSLASLALSGRRRPVMAAKAAAALRYLIGARVPVTIDDVMITGGSATGGGVSNLGLRNGAAPQLDH